MSIFTTTAAHTRRYGVALWAGVIGGIISGLVKTGSEGPMPPRTPDRASPPNEMLQDLGIQWKQLTYTYSEKVLNWGGFTVHELLSVAAAMFYCVLAEIFPAVKMWYGSVFAIIFAFVFHGVILPVFGWSPALQNLPFDEILSEIVGTVLWMVVIEVFRRDIRSRMTNKPDPEFQS